MRCLLILALLLPVSTLSCWSQEIKNDTLKVEHVNPTDTLFISGDKEIIEIKSNSKYFDPRKAILYSAVFPGSGQFYNRKYWKVPLVYGGFGALIYIASFYHKENLRYREQLFNLINEPPANGLSPDGFTKDQLRTLVDKTRRERDFFIIMNGLWYILQMVDAQVDAHLKEFDINPQMQVRIEPMMENSMMTGRSSGFSFKIRF
jgi:hypothetical protein